jgi:hypothetical protein
MLVSMRTRAGHQGAQPATRVFPYRRGVFRPARGTRPGGSALPRFRKARTQSVYGSKETVLRKKEVSTLLVAMKEVVGAAHYCYKLRLVAERAATCSVSAAPPPESCIAFTARSAAGRRY